MPDSLPLFPEKAGRRFRMIRNLRSIAWQADFVSPIFFLIWRTELVPPFTGGSGNSKTVNTVFSPLLNASTCLGFRKFRRLRQCDLAGFLGSSRVDRFKIAVIVIDVDRAPKLVPGISKGYTRRSPPRKVIKEQNKKHRWGAMSMFDSDCLSVSYSIVCQLWLVAFC